MRLRLTTIGEGFGATFGSLELSGGARLFTVEPPWLDNAPGLSCVPAGFYALEPHDSARHGQTWALVGATVGHYPSEGYPRNLCTIHAANFAAELAGCIAPGRSIAMIDGALGVTESQRALAQLLALLPRGGRHYLEITPGPTAR